MPLVPGRRGSGRKCHSGSKSIENSTHPADTKTNHDDVARPAQTATKLRASWSCLVALVLGSSQAEAQDRVTLPDHVLSILDGAHAAPRRANAAQQPMTLTVLLKRTDGAGFGRFLRSVHDPASPLFRQFLSARELSDRFGPSQASYDAVRAYFVGQGFKVTEGSSNRLTLTLRGTRAQAERALAVTIGDFVVGNRRFYANTRNPALPSGVASKVAAIAGLSDLGIPRREPVSIEQFYAACAALLVGAAAMTVWIRGRGSSSARSDSSRGWRSLSSGSVCSAPSWDRPPSRAPRLQAS